MGAGLESYDRVGMKFDPKTLAGKEGLERFAAFIRTFVDLGVYHVQFNVVDKETLVAAQKRPEDHRSLMVRVAGSATPGTRSGRS